MYMERDVLTDKQRCLVGLSGTTNKEISSFLYNHLKRYKLNSEDSVVFSYYLQIALIMVTMDINSNAKAALNEVYAYAPVYDEISRDDAHNRLLAPLFNESSLQNSKSLLGGFLDSAYHDNQLVLLEVIEEVKLSFKSVGEKWIGRWVQCCAKQFSALSPNIDDAFQTITLHKRISYLIYKSIPIAYPNVLLPPWWVYKTYSYIDQNASG